MKNLRTLLGRHRLLLFSLLLYLILYVFEPAQFQLASSQSLFYLLEMLRVMPIVFVMTLLIDAWVPHKTIQKALGKDANIKGAFYAFLLGSLSAGPVYAAFPLGKMLFHKGASVRNVVIILSAWAVIKVPMLANELRFLGLEFMAFRWVLTVVAIYLMGSIMQRVIDPSHLHIETEEQTKDLMVDERVCIGCQKCVQAFPEHFHMHQEKAQRIESSSVGDQAEEMRSVCPVLAIVYEEKKSA